MKVEQKLTEMGIELPLASPPGALYVPVKRTGDLLYVSGQVPFVDGKPVFTGKVGAERSIEYGQDAARQCIKNMLAVVKAFVGDLDRISNVVKINGFVASELGFDKQHIVMNAASQLLMDVFGACGAHARSAIGVNQLPLNVTVEIEGIFEVGKDAA
jgi:enamine deaminase RidA (YjgF/YER057c/UK114 family)